jgi:hypothetical protein
MSALSFNSSDTIIAYLALMLSGAFTGLILWFVRFIFFTWFDYPKKTFMP